MVTRASLRVRTTTAPCGAENADRERMLHGGSGEPEGDGYATAGGVDVGRVVARDGDVQSYTGDTATESEISYNATPGDAHVTQAGREDSMMATAERAATEPEGSTLLPPDVNDLGGLMGGGGGGAMSGVVQYGESDYEYIDDDADADIDVDL